MKFNISKKKTVGKLLEEYEKGKLTEKNLLSKLFLQFNENELEYVLSSLLTKHEIDTFAHRLLIIKMLKNDIFQHEISKKLKVGVTTVTRGAEAIRNGKFDFI